MCVCASVCGDASALVTRGRLHGRVALRKPVCGAARATRYKQRLALTLSRILLAHAKQCTPCARFEASTTQLLTPAPDPALSCTRVAQASAAPVPGAPRQPRPVPLAAPLAPGSPRPASRPPAASSCTRSALHSPARCVAVVLARHWSPPCQRPCCPCWARTRTRRDVFPSVFAPRHMQQPGTRARGQQCHPLAAAHQRAAQISRPRPCCGWKGSTWAGQSTR